MDEKKSQVSEATKNVIDKTKELTTHEIHSIYDNAKVLSDSTYNLAIAGKEKSESQIRRVSFFLLFISLE